MVGKKPVISAYPLIKYLGVRLTPKYILKIFEGFIQISFNDLIYSKPFTYAICLDQLGAEVVQKYIGREPSGRNFNEIALDYKGTYL